jgi:hypothetical protein
VNWRVAAAGAVLYAITHIIQDWNIWNVYKKYRDTKKEFQNDYWFYSTIAIDQTVHLIIMFLITKYVIEMS